MHYSAIKAVAALLLFSLLSACQTVAPKPVPPARSQQAPHQDPQKVLAAAAVQGNVEVLKRLLDSGIDPNFHSVFRGWTPLTLAAASGHGEAVKMLIAANADPNLRATKDGTTPLIRAAQAGDAEICALLLRQGAAVDVQDSELGASALMHAAFVGHDRVIKVLRAAGAKLGLRDHSGTTALMLAATNAGPDTVKLLLEQGADPNIGSFYGFTPLMRVAGRGQVEAVSALIDAGANVYRKDVNGKAAINHARDAKKKTNRHAQVVRLLKAHGADVNGANRQIDRDLLEAALRGRLQEVRQLIAKGADSNARDGRGFTVLMKASGHPKTAAYLIEQGADPFALNRGKGSLLHDAASSGNLTLVKRLLALGAAIDPINNNKETPLCEATQTGKLAVVRLLLEQGADPNIRSRFGTPLMLAIERDNQAMINLLKQWGAH